MNIGKKKIIIKNICNIYLFIIKFYSSFNDFDYGF